MFNTSVGIGFLIGFFFIGRARATLVVTVSTTHAGVGPVSNMPEGICTHSVLPLMALESVREGNLVNFVVVFTSMSLLLVTNVLSRVAVVGSVSNMSNGIKTRLPTTLDALLGPCACFAETFLTWNLRNV